MDMETIKLLQLPEDALQQIAICLCPKDLLSFLCIHSAVYQSLSLSKTFWMYLLKHKFDYTCDPALPIQHVKQLFLQYSYCHELPSVKWLPVNESVHSPTGREGHVCCVLDNYLIVTGGFVEEDKLLFCKDLDPESTNLLGWSVVLPEGSNQLRFTYGSTLTPIGPNRALLFGGFQAGGYSAESHQVAVLTVRTVSGQIQATWEFPCVSTTSGRPITEAWAEEELARAYHTATLLNDQYLLFVGGMKSSQSTIKPVLLDIKNWKWLDDRPITSDADAPSPRHGHSMIYDSYRNRLVLFGGGSGSDLLRSGQDNSEVYQLRLNGFTAQNDLESSLPWTWSRILEDQHIESCGVQHSCIRNRDDPRHLHTAETCILGRCHASHKVSRDKVILMFGSGRPCTNGLIVYDLAKDEWQRPTILGPVPRSRFTFASVFVEKQAFIYCHGGYSSSLQSTIAEAVVLDLAPALERPIRHMAVNPYGQSFSRLSDEEVWNHRNLRANSQMENIFLHFALTGQVISSTIEWRELLSRRFSVRRMRNSVGNDEMVDSDDDDDDDDDYEEEEEEDDDDDKDDVGGESEES